MTKKSAYVIGNCQAFPVRNILSMSKNFLNYFDLVSFPAVHVAKPENVEQLHAALPHAGLLVAQNISDNYRNNIGLGTETLRSKMANDADFISWPSLFFSLYNPELFYLKNEAGASVNDTFDYHVHPIFESYAQGLDVDQCAQAYKSSNSVDIQDVDKFASTLHKRESGLSVKSSKFILDRFQKQRLFHTFNHPAAPVLLHTAQQILTALGIRNDLPSALKDDPLDTTVYPVTRNVRAFLSLDFEEDEILRVRGVEKSIQTSIVEYYSFYERNPDLVQINAQRLFGISM